MAHSNRTEEEERGGGSIVCPLFHFLFRPSVRPAADPFLCDKRTEREGKRENESWPDRRKCQKLIQNWREMRVVGIVEKERRSVEDTAAWLRAQRADWMCPDARFIVALFFFFPFFFFFLRTGLAVSLLLIASWSADWSHITHVDSRSGNHRHHYGPTGAAAYASPLVANEGQDGTFPGYWQEDAVMSHVIQCASALSLSSFHAHGRFPNRYAVIRCKMPRVTVAHAFTCCWTLSRRVERCIASNTDK